MVACVGTFSVVNLLSPDDVIAGKNDPVMTEEGNNTIVKEGQGQPGENLGGDTMIEPDWDKVAVIKKSYPDMLIPGYVPEGYEFKELQVSAMEEIEVFTFLFKQEEESLMIQQVLGAEMKVIKSYTRSMKTENGTEIRIKEDESKVAYCFIDESMYIIEGSISDEEYIRIVEKLER
ncbi:MAG: DUF4367 domain-containing protein, partial [Emergencia sp.]|nr:DUF4367 domain-containing protein [Emergencia sp.]